MPDQGMKAGPEKAALGGSCVVSNNLASFRWPATSFDSWHAVQGDGKDGLPECKRSTATALMRWQMKLGPSEWPSSPIHKEL